MINCNRRQLNDGVAFEIDTSRLKIEKDESLPHPTVCHSFESYSN